MSRAARNTLAMVRIAWSNGPVLLVAAAVLSVGAGLAWPVVASALRAGTDDMIGRDVHGATVAGAVTGLGMICVLMLRHFAYTAIAELSELSTITLDRELIALSAGSPGLAHHEDPDHAAGLDILRRDVQMLGTGIGALMSMATLAVSLVSTGVILASVNPWLLLLPPAAVPPVLAGRRATRITEQAKEDSARPTQQSWHLFRLATAAGSAMELRVFNLRDRVRRRDRQLWDEAGRTVVRAERRAAVVGAVGQLFFAAAYVLAVLMIIRQTAAGHGSVGDVVLVVTLAAQISQQVGQALQELRNLQRIQTGFTRMRWLRELVGTRAADAPAQDAAAPERIADGIDLTDVTFRYRGRSEPILRGASAHIPAGATIAVVGENGAGKTTLVKLLCRFYEQQSGTVAVDEVDIRRFPLDRWRARIAAGFQDFVRFELPAGRSVGIGDLPRAQDDAAVLAALDRADALDVVGRLREGLDTPLGRSHADGDELSGGQWQKLALGRAFMRESPLLLVLDEPTAALDPQAEHDLFERYAARAAQTAGRTGAITVLVTHRFSTARTADLILVVADGRVAELGSHAELMECDGIYAELYNLQAAAYR